MHGIINALVDTPSLLSKLTFTVPSSSKTTRGQIIFRVPTSTTNMSRNHPIKRMMEAANEYCKVYLIQVDFYFGARLQFIMMTYFMLI